MGEVGEGWDRFKGIPVMNRSYCYLFPIIGLSAQIPKENFINLKGVFLLNEDYPELHDVLYLVFQRTGDRRSELFRQSLKNEYNYHSEYHPDKVHSVIIMRIPSEYYREYDKFMDSKYSEFSENYKQSIIRFHRYTRGKNKDGNSIIQILYKDEDMYRKWEKKINEGLPEGRWTYIPRSQECEKRWDGSVEDALKETFTKDLKVQEDLIINKQ